jgi:hypothetical protein
MKTAVPRPRDNACAVIAPVFQPPQTLEKEVRRLPFSHITNDAAHVLQFREGLKKTRLPGRGIHKDSLCRPGGQPRVES